MSIQSKQSVFNASTSNHTLTLKDGRTLGYAEYGEPTGVTVIGFHGMPGSRLVMKSIEKAAIAAGARLIAPDRPGYGLSQPNRQCSLLHYVRDVAELADALQIERFAVLGISGGGPNPLACAYQIPQCITVAALVSAIGPLGLPHSTSDMMRVNRVMFNLGRLSPRLTGLILPRLIRSSLPSMEQHVRQGTSPSADLSPEIFAIMTADQREAIRGGGQGIVFDMQILWRPWGFEFEDIHTKVTMWHGVADHVAPARLARHLADHLPNCEATFYPNEGHIDPLTKHIDEIMARVVASYARPSQAAVIT